MPTTHPEFNEKTEALDVAKAFADQIRGRTVLVTGVNRGGIGFTTAQAFASQSPAHLIFAGRTPAKLEECIGLIKAEYPDVDYRALQIDLSSQKSVRAAAAELLSWADVPAIDIVVNSAGVMGTPERTLTAEGIELHMATNHVGHFLLTCLIAAKLVAAAGRRGGARAVNVTSASPTVAVMRWSDPRFETRNADLPAAEQPRYEMLELFGNAGPRERAYVPVEAYNQSKVANVLFSVGANARLLARHGVLSLAVHPGVIPTELGRDFTPANTAALEAMRASGFLAFKTLGAGAATSLVAALDPALGPPDAAPRDGRENHGVYLADCQISDKAQPLAVSSAEAERLWKASEEMVQQKFEW
ncbi:NAD(P)-binding protein [Durotheca rogersii]|uniref:NAD(P)-binding protein n=1 Tax=Durotheca rogersii TaxID=419775 RepID=UPI0022211DCE|nr:NAD(P)-binding protein [Durotheca rogersii]KAI5860070.1 NAD(P)-binding protein [Durotheca rogersii]